MISEFTNPINAINKPIPTDIAFFTLRGILSIMASLTFRNVKIMKIIPSRNTAVKANCQVLPIPSTTAYVKNAFSPIPGASAKGRFACSAITRVAIRDDKAVAVNTAPNGIPASMSMSGFTIRM